MMAALEPRAPCPSDDVRARVLALLRMHGWNTTSFQVLERGFSYWFDEAAQPEACVAYVDTGGAWVAAGAPIASDAALVSSARRFIAAARSAGRRACFFAVEDRLVRGGALASMPIGEQPSWLPSRWEEVVRGDRRLREQLRRARAKGVRVRALSAAEVADATTGERQRVERLVSHWLRSRRMPPMGFVVDVQLFELPEERRWFVAEQDGRLVGLLVSVPVFRRRGWLFEDLLRVPDAPNGTTELLVDRAMRGVAEEGSEYVTLGLAPLAGDVPPWLRLLRGCVASLYDFDGVRRFKAKLRPDAWTPIHLAWPHGESSNVALLDALAAFTLRPSAGKDRASFVRFGLETLAHAPALGVRVLAVLLVPWTIALAAAPTGRFFPSRAVQLAWVAFDVMLALAMLVLALRWRVRLARGLAVATSVDAALTFVEVAFDGWHRVHGPLQAALLVVACAGPLLATSQLWGALVWQAPAEEGRVHVR